MARKDKDKLYPLQTMISREAAAYLTKLAEEDDRSLVKYAKKVIMDHLKDKGYVEGSVEPLPIKEIQSSNEDEKSQKKSNSTVAEKELKQSANCNTLSVTNRTRGRNSKVAPVQMSFVK